MRKKTRRWGSRENEYFVTKQENILIRENTGKLRQIFGCNRLALVQ
jgi:hypothetical protein